jgi:hypothetical protein
VTVLAGKEAFAEAEEYDKELEERIFPPDEVELKQRMEQNAERQRDPTVDEMPETLGLPVEVVKRT